MQHPMAMTVSLARIGDTGLAFDVEVSASLLHFPAMLDVTFTAPIRVQGHLSKVAEQVYFRGTACGTITAVCGRCLEDIRQEFTVALTTVYLPASAASQEDEDEGSALDEAIDVYTHDGMTLDLQPAVYDHVLLELPVQPLCRPDCAGLCQVCGGNRNEVACTCHVAQGDPRFAALKQLSFPQSS